MSRLTQTTPTKRIGIADLIAVQFERCSFAWTSLVSRDEDYAGADHVSMLPRVAQLFSNCAAGVLEAARRGEYLPDAMTWGEWWDDTDADPLLHERAEEAYWHLLETLEQSLFAVWLPFIEACELAERIDSFLAALSTDNTTAAFARGCRDDLTTLLILADWCDEHNLPHAASEARHLRNLTRYLLR
jgi:hypothetical protein